jgi:hypothetical protein
LACLLQQVQVGLLAAAAVALVLQPALLLRWEGGSLLLQQSCRCRLQQADVCY